MTTHKSETREHIVSDVCSCYTQVPPEHADEEMVSSNRQVARSISPLPTLLAERYGLCSHFIGPISPYIAVCVVHHEWIRDRLRRFFEAVDRRLADDIVGSVLPCDM